jgi:hypothetical protein
MNSEHLNKEKNTPSLTPEDRAEILAEFEALRDEIIKRQESRHQLLTFTLILAATILSFGTEKDTSVLVLLIYPVLGFFLALYMKHIQSGAVDISQYIKDNIESRLLSLGWEKRIRDLQNNKKRHFISRTKGIPIFGIFVVTEIIAVILAIPKIGYQPNSSPISIEEISLLSVDLIAIALTFYIFRHRVDQQYLIKMEVKEQARASNYHNNSRN